jgi:hypothetical protein
MIEPGLWRWRFQIGETATTGTTKTNLRGMAAHRVKSRIDREFNKSRKLGLAGNQLVRPQLAASLSSSEAFDIACWHFSDMRASLLSGCY